MNIKEETWRELLKNAYELAATRSPDPSTQNAAILVNNDGVPLISDVNRFPDGVEYKPERWDRPLKYQIIEHAERNSIYAAASEGIKTKGLTMVCPWAACSNCARAIIQAGIRRVVTHKQAADRSSAFWQEEIDVAFMMFDEAKVEVLWYDGVIGVEKEVRHSGQFWKP